MLEGKGVENKGETRALDGQWPFVRPDTSPLVGSVYILEYIGYMSIGVL